MSMSPLLRRNGRNRGARGYVVIKPLSDVAMRSLLRRFSRKRGTHSTSRLVYILKIHLYCVCVVIKHNI